MKKILLLIIFAIAIQSSYAQSWFEVGGLDALNANSSMYGLCSDPSGNIYTSGTFTDSLGYRYVAKWDGKKWSELKGLNANGNIITLCSDKQGNIYAGGLFTNSSGNYYVAKWDGNSWTELGGLNSLAANKFIEVIYCDSKNNIYVGGNFTGNTGYSYYIAIWNGIGWSKTGELKTIAFENGIYGLCVDSSGNIYAGGDLFDYTSYYTFYIAKWNGSNWTKIYDTLINGITYTMCIDGAENIYVAGEDEDSLGNQIVLKWNGNNWSELGGPNDIGATNWIFSIISDAMGNVYATTNFPTDSGGNTIVTKWNGTEWTKMGGIHSKFTNFVVQTLCLDPSNNIYAAGDISDSTGHYYVAEYGSIPTTSPSIHVADFQCRLFPNPAEDIVTFQSDNNSDASISLYDVSGRLLFTDNLNGKRTKQLDISTLAQGMYLLEAKFATGELQTMKVIKE